MSSGPAGAGARSRLRWFDAPDDAVVPEIPHLAGHPVDDAVPGDLVRVREWPNRLGVAEAPRPGDQVRWYPLLAERPPIGDVVALETTGQASGGSTPADLEDRTAWLHRLVTRLSQGRGIGSAADVVAPCTVVLTPGVGDRRSWPDHGWGNALATVPRRLAEFPGGLQLVVTDSVWARREEYADHVLAIMDGGT